MLRCAIPLRCWLLAALPLLVYSYRDAEILPTRPRARARGLLELYANDTHDRSTLCDVHSHIGWHDTAATARQCQACTEVSKRSGSCKWCPLEQRCVKTGLGSGGPCKVRETLDGDEDPRDKKVKGTKDSARCEEEPHWESTMKDAYGDAWEKTFSVHPQYSIGGNPLPAERFKDVTSVPTAEAACLRDTQCAAFEAVGDVPTFTFHGFSSSMSLNMVPQGSATAASTNAYLSGRVHHQDSLRCFQWAMDWPITGLGKDEVDGDKVSVDDIGSWACTSAIVRDTSLRMLGQTWKSPFQLLEQMGVDTLEWVPSICSVIKNKMESNHCGVAAHKVTEFAHLRKSASATGGRSQVTQDMDASIRSGPLLSFKPGAGLSGSTFASTYDGRYKLKMGLKTNPDEPGNLMKMLGGDDGRPKLADHLEQNPSSVLNRYYGLLKIDMGPSGSSGRHQWALWMEDASYLMDAKVTAAGIKSPVWNDDDDRAECTDPKHCLTRYDLKGKSRNQFRKQKKHKIFTMENGDFGERESAYLKLGESQCLGLRAAVEADSKYLDQYELIDYSFFLTVTDGATDKGVTCQGTPGEPQCLVSDSRDKLYTISTIDYLNDYSLKKKAESFWYKVTARGWKFSEYGGKMVQFVHKICRTKEELKEYLVVNKAIQEHYGSGDRREALMKAYDACKDKDDGMSFKGFQEVLSQVGISDSRDKKEWKSLFDDVDTTHEGFIDFEEFSYAFG